MLPNQVSAARVQPAAGQGVRSTLAAMARSPVETGVLVGLLAPILVLLGNPGNMGFCIACFTRDIAGALGLHRAATVQFLRPEIMGLVLGATVAALVHREFRPRTGSAPVVRFVLGALGMMGALVFLGCPWRAYLRLAGGDWNAIPGIVGLVAGVGAGVLFLKQGYSLGRNHPSQPLTGWTTPAIMAGLLLLALFSPLLGRDAAGAPTGPIFASLKGPGSQHANLAVALVAGLAVGYLAQRSRFCSVGGIRDLILLRDAHLLNGILTLIGVAFLLNLLTGQFHPGMQNQPVAHSNVLWNLGGMVLAGVAFTLAGGCPARQLVLAGEGDADAAMVVLGMVAGAAFAHNFTLASSPAGPSLFGPAAVLVGLVICAVVGLTAREVA